MVSLSRSFSASRSRRSQVISPPLLLTLLLALGTPVLTAHSNAEIHDSLLFGNFAQSSDATAERIVELHLQARGGREAIDRIISLRREGALREGRTDHRFTWQWSRSSGAREDRTRELRGRHHHLVRVANPQTTWGQTIGPSLADPRELDDEEAAALRWEGDLYSGVHRSFLEGSASGVILAFAGEARLHGKAAYAIQVRHTDGRKGVYYFARDSFLLLGVRFREQFADRMVTVEAIPTGYVRIEGVVFETGFDYRVNDAVYRSVRFEHTATNPRTDPSVFRKPEVVEVWLRS